MDQHEQDLLAEVREAVKAAEVRICITPTFTHGEGIRLEVKTGSRWKRVGPLLFPPEGGSTTDTLLMLGEMRTGKAVLA